MGNNLLKQILVVVLVSFGYSCSLININLEPIAATVTELSTCNEDGESIEVFSPSDKRIYVCGHIQTLQPVDINIYWYYEGELVFQQIGEDINGHFHSFVEPGTKGAFSKGDYQVDILIGGVVAKGAEFQVE